MTVLFVIGVVFVLCGAWFAVIAAFHSLPRVEHGPYCAYCGACKACFDAGLIADHFCWDNPDGSRHLWNQERRADFTCPKSVQRRGEGVRRTARPSPRFLKEE